LNLKGQRKNIEPIVAYTKAFCHKFGPNSNIGRLSF